MTTLTISLPESLRHFIDRQVKTKGFGNTSEYVRSLVRDAQEAESSKRLETLLLEGLDRATSDGIEADRKFWPDLKAEASTLLAKRKSQPNQSKKNKIRIVGPSSSSRLPSRGPRSLKPNLPAPD